MGIFKWARRQHAAFKAFQVEDRAHRQALINYEKKHGKYSTHNRPRGAPIPKKYYPRRKRK